MNSVLIIGCGSIGSRHARNARLLGIEVIVSDPNEERAQSLASEVGARAWHRSHEDAIQTENIDAAIIAAPSSLHVSIARTCIENGIPVFMEKPLATSLDGLDELVSLARQKKVPTMMGQSFRFHEGLLAAHERLERGDIGAVLHAHFLGGQYLPDWHPEEDYRLAYVARKDLGGGVLRTSMSHTLDTIEWFFGSITQVVGMVDRLGALELDVDDSAFLVTKTESRVIAYTQFDFLQRPHRNRLTIVGTKGVLEVDLIEHTITHIDRESGTTKTAYAFDSNKRYVDELQHFAMLVDTDTEDPAIDIAHGKHLVELMLDPNIRDLTTQHHGVDS